MSSAWPVAEGPAPPSPRSFDLPTVVLVDLGRQGALGAERRLDSWRLLWADVGGRTSTVKLVRDCPARPLGLVLQLARTLLLRRTPWESLLWSRRALRRRLAKLNPDVVVFCTHRSFDPSVAPRQAVVVLDLVDRLSENYRQRGDLAGPLGKAAFALLASRMSRLENSCWPGVVRTAAGRRDAEVLEAAWLPNVVQVPVPPARGAPAQEDVLFVGSLDYAPNVEGLRMMARVWPHVLDRRPGARMLVAGRRPGAAVQTMAEECGWTLLPDFAVLAEVCARTRIAVAPLAVATGIQNKVLETSAAGLAQIVHPAVLAGLGPDFPAVVAADDRQLLEALMRLLDAPAGDVAAAGALAREAVERAFSVAAHAGWCRELLSSHTAGDAAATYLGRAPVALRP